MQMQDHGTSPAENQDWNLNPEPDISTLTAEDRALLTTCCDWPDAGPKFNALWCGDWDGFYPSQSEADSGFIYMLAKVSNDMRQITRIFMASGLGWRLRTGKKKKHDNYVFDMVNDAMRDKGPIAKIETDGEWVRHMSKSEPNVPQIETVPVPSRTKTNQQPKRGLVIKPMTDYKPTEAEWLWYRHLPLKRLAILAGVGSAGKSTLALKMAATVSSGGTWPDGTQCPQGQVLIWSGEDRADEDMRPRLDAMGADVKKIHNIECATDEHGNKVPFNPLYDIPQITKMLQDTPGISLVIISPLVSLVKGDMNASNVTRDGLQALVDMAELTGVCVLGLTHFRKDSAGESPIDRVLGSGAFTQLPRVVMGAVRSPDGMRRALAVIKSNNGRESQGAYEYEIRGKAVRYEGYTISAENCSEIVWGEFISGVAQEIFDDIEGVEAKGDKQQSKVEGAKSFLTGQLANGRKVPTKELDALAKEIGISRRSYTQAKTELNVKSLPNGLGKPWVSSLPDTAVQIDIPVPPQWGRQPT